MQGNDNDWFLNRNYKGDFATAGSLFLDYRNANDFGDKFSIIYGHRMGNGEMFSDIQKYKTRTFFEEHHSGSLRQAEQSFKIEIIAYAEIDADD